MAFFLTRGGEDAPIATTAEPQPASVSASQTEPVTDGPVASTPSAADIEPPPPAPAANATIELRLVAPASTTLRVNETLRLRANTIDARTTQVVSGPAVSFTSSDRSVATVDRRTGEVRGVTPGRVTITAEASDAGRETVRLTIAPSAAATAAPASDLSVAPTSTTPAVSPPVRTPTAPITAPITAPANAPPPVGGTPAAAETTVVSQAQLAREARAVLDAYARAFATMDVGRLRSLNPSLPAEEQAFYTDLFRNSESVTLTVTSVTPSGSRREYDATNGATTSLTATFEFVFVSKNRRIGRQASEGRWQVSLQRDDAGWKLVRLVTG